jgi:hypothetical protein
MHDMVCSNCNKTFQCTKLNHWSNCKAESKVCICLDCWKLSFDGDSNLLLSSLLEKIPYNEITKTRDINKLEKLRNDMIVCYGKEALTVDEL